MKTICKFVVAVIGSGIALPCLVAMALVAIGILWGRS